MKTIALLLVGLSLACACDDPHPLDLIRVENIKIQLDRAITLSVTPRVLDTSGSWVTVTWDGVDTPSSKDWIGLYSPANTTVTRSVPIKYQFASAGEAHTGGGSYRFRLINMRADLVFAFFRNGTDHPVLSALSQSISFTNYNEPLQTHLALTANSGEMSVQWNTRDRSGPYVRWGQQSGVYTAKAAAESTTYTVKEMCGEPANSTGWREPGLLHSAVMTDLASNTRYYYVVGDVYGVSSEFTFIAPPQVNADASFTFFLFGDLGQSELDGSMQQSYMTPSLNTTQAIHADDHFSQAQLVVHIGDISYARGYVSQWDNFFSQIEPIASAMPWMTCDGNHERDWPGSGSLFDVVDSGGECGVAYEKRLRMPTSQLDKAWFSFDFGNVHFLLFSTEHNFTVGSEQYNFIASDLAKVDRTRTPWLIVGGHRPMYISSTNWDQPAGDQPVAVSLRANLEQLFNDHQVDAAFFGHHHSYQRSCPVYKSACVSTNDGSYAAPVYFVSGAGGAGNSGNIQSPPPPFSLFVNCVTHGYTRAIVTARTLQFQYVAGLDGEILDDVTIKMPTDRQRKLGLL